MVFNIQAVSFTLVQLITASSASSPTVPKEPRSLNLKASSTGSAGSPLASSLTVPKEPRSLSLSKGPPTAPHCFGIYPPVSELVEGALTKPHIYTVAHASGSERSVLFPWLFLLLIFRVSASVFSVFFRVFPWLILPLLSFHHSVANLLLLLRLTFVANFLLCLCLLCDFNKYLQK